MTTVFLPIVDLTRTLQGEIDMAAARVAVDSLHKYGMVIIRDPRVSAEANLKYRKLMLEYYRRPYAERLADQRKDGGYQVGASPPGHEKAFDYSAMAAAMAPENRPTPLPADYAGDPKERFMWPAGPRPAKDKTRFPLLNQEGERVVPAAFRGVWAETLDPYANMLRNAGLTTTLLIERGMNMVEGLFERMAQNAPHLLGPNAINLRKFLVAWTIFNAFHNDLNFLTIHGKSNFPALRAWLRDGTPMIVRIPDGCLLVQVARQLEHMSGGYFVAGYHEAVCLPETLAAVARLSPEEDAIRISGSFFLHLASDQILEILPGFLPHRGTEAEELQRKYPRTYVGTDVWKILVGLGIASTDIAEFVTLD